MSPAQKIKAANYGQVLLNLVDASDSAFLALINCKEMPDIDSKKIQKAFMILMNERANALKATRQRI